MRSMHFALQINGLWLDKMQSRPQTLCNGKQTFTFSLLAPKKFLDVKKCGPLLTHSVNCALQIDGLWLDKVQLRSQTYFVQFVAKNIIVFTILLRAVHLVKYKTHILCLVQF